jgi:hypothetical protein
MAADKPKIAGFSLHGGRYRAFVSLEEADARDVSTEATERAVPVARVLEDRVRGTRRKRGAGKREPLATVGPPPETKKGAGS